MAAIMALFKVEPDDEDAAVGALMIWLLLKLGREKLTGKRS